MRIVLFMWFILLIYVVYIAFLYGVYCHLILCLMLTVEALR